MKKQKEIDGFMAYMIGESIVSKQVFDDIQSLLKKWKEEMMKELGLNTYTVGVASARREDLGTPKADPESEYNKGYRDATNKMKEWLRVKLEEV